MHPLLSISSMAYLGCISTNMHLIIAYLSPRGTEGINAKYTPVETLLDLVCHIGSTVWYMYISKERQYLYIHVHDPILYMYMQRKARQGKA